MRSAVAMILPPVKRDGASDVPARRGDTDTVNPARNVPWRDVEQVANGTISQRGRCTDRPNRGITKFRCRQYSRG